MQKWTLVCELFHNILIYWDAPVYIKNRMQNAVNTVNNTIIFQSDTYKHVDSKQTEPLQLIAPVLGLRDLYKDRSQVKSICLWCWPQLNGMYNFQAAMDYFCLSK